VDSIMIRLMSTVGELEVSLVHQRRGRKRVAWPVSGELPVGPIVELAIDQGKETIERTTVSFAERREQGGDIAFHWHVSELLTGSPLRTYRTGKGAASDRGCVAPFRRRGRFPSYRGTTHEGGAMRHILLLTIGLLAASVTTERAEAQLLKRITERVKQKVTERKAQTEEAVLSHAAEPADSAMAKVTSPVESLATRVGGGAGAAVGRMGRGEGKASAEATRIREELAAGRATLPGVAFVPGADAIDPSSEPSLRALATVIAESPAAFLVQARADAGAPPQDALQLAGARATAIKTWLVGNGVPADRVFAAGDATAMPNAAPVTVVPMQ
jgi:outer membrane protein OmpA-like peptidoglycan-associated protein